MAVPASIYDVTVRTISGVSMSLADYRGTVLLVVNVASRCGYTPQYEGLEALYRRHRDRGFVVLGFPCDQFGHQEPGSDSDIREFCSSRYDVTFPLFGKIDFNGPAADPLYVYLKARKTGWLGSSIKWNFTKFLIDRRGDVVRRFAPADKPEAIEPAVLALL
jgi:glutathione peroxidase